MGDEVRVDPGVDSRIVYHETCEDRFADVFQEDILEHGVGDEAVGGLHGGSVHAEREPADRLNPRLDQRRRSLVVQPARHRGLMERRIAAALRTINEASRRKADALLEIKDQPPRPMVVVPMVRPDREPILEVRQFHICRPYQLQPRRDGIRIRPAGHTLV